METDPEQAMERDIEELEQRIDGVDEGIGEAKDAARGAQDPLSAPADDQDEED